ncbi:DUF547 domain-containing protein [uncultured Pseudoteredinibacter sp.]|uniref:DUF547 domain-containing protein n=1 Tax=uncultured Pseudoteredinibacter sp. TaxID=1641701 RepID=UPI002604C6A8|nr:DUF547 domain-containing protein [uncultured Pseudoteredinibacter sp.]
MSRKSFRLLLNLCLCGVLCFTFTLEAAPQAELWEEWLPSPSATEEYTERPSWALWQAFLERYVSTDSSGLNRVDYAAVTEDDKLALNRLQDSLVNVDPRGWSDSEQQAFWINSYNLSVVSLVLQHYPVSSIKDIRLSFKSLFNGGPWEDKLIKVAGIKLSLNDIEHRILRPIWKDQRFHFALNCASVGCPNLANDIYRAQTLNEQLNLAEKTFLQSLRGFERTDNAYQVSSIFNWYWRDFSDKKTNLWEYFQKQGLIDEPVEGFQYQYDWSLNEAMPETR